MIRRPPRSTLSSSSAASDVYKRQVAADYVSRRSTSSADTRAPARCPGRRTPGSPPANDAPAPSPGASTGASTRSACPAVSRSGSPGSSTRRTGSSRSKSMHSTPNPSRVRFTGPLAPFAAGLVDEFARLGYPASTATAKMQFAAHLSRWLAECGSGPAELTGPVVDRFLIARRAGYSNYVGVGAVRPVLEYLQRVGAAPVSAVEPPASPAEALLARFGGYLTGERALTVPVAQAYCHWVRPFVENVLWRGDIDRCGEFSGGETAWAVAEVGADDRVRFAFVAAVLALRGNRGCRFGRCGPVRGVLEGGWAGPAGGCRAGSGAARGCLLYTSPSPTRSCGDHVDVSVGFALRRGRRVAVGGHRLGAGSRDRPRQGQSDGSAAAAGRRRPGGGGLSARWSAGDIGSRGVRSRRRPLHGAGEQRCQLHCRPGGPPGGAGNGPRPPAPAHRGESDPERGRRS